MFVYLGSTKSSAIGKKTSVIIGILGAVVVVMAIALIILFCRMWKRKRDKPYYTQPTIEIPRIPVSEGGYEEPAQYQQLDSSRRVPVDANYQSLQNANYTQLNMSLKEVVQQYASLIKDGSSTTDNAPEQ
jgi:flagellar basal body-associated protein FliL